TLPWVHLSARPFFDVLMPVRFSLYTALVTAVVVALWLAGTGAGAWGGVGVPALAVLAGVPHVGLAELGGPGGGAPFSPPPPADPAALRRRLPEVPPEERGCPGTAVRSSRQFAHLAGEERVLVPPRGRLHHEHGATDFPAAAGSCESRNERRPRGDHTRG